LEEQAFVRVHNSEGDEELKPREGVQLSEGHVIMRMALEQLLLEEHLPESVTWLDFSSLLGECVDWAKTRRSKIRVAKKSKGSTTAAGAGAGAGAGASGGGDIPAPKAVVAKTVETATPASWIKAAERRLSEWRSTFRGTALDVGFSKTEIILRRPTSLLAAASKQQVNFYLMPSSAARKQRRLLFASAVFEIASADDARGGITLDALEQYLSRERSRLLRFISLAGEGDVVFPHVEQNYRAAQLGELPFSVVRAIICCHVLSSSEQLRTLREGLQSSDGGGGGDCLVNLVGFCRAVEEAVFNVSNHLNENPALLVINGGEVDQAVSELRLLATESRMTLMNSDSHAMHKKGSTFTLGLLDFLDGVGDEGGEGGEGGGAKLTVDAASIASRRRSSRLSELGGGGGGGKGGLKEKEMPPVVWLFCDYHGVEKFYIADLCCCACEKEWLISEGAVGV